MYDNLSRRCVLMFNRPMRKLAAMILAMTTLGTIGFASRVIQMSFEAAARTAGVVVLATITVSDELGTVRKYSTGTTMVSVSC